MRNRRHEDILASKRISIIMDVIAREGFELSTAQLHNILGEGRCNLLPDRVSLRAKCSDESAAKGYSVLVWASSSDGRSLSAEMFATRVQRYYEHIGALEYYRGLIDA